MILPAGSFKAMLTDVIVHPDYQGQGFERIVVEDLLNQCRQCMKKGDMLCVESNPTAGNRDFYIRCGMKYDPEAQDGLFLWLYS